MRVRLGVVECALSPREVTSASRHLWSPWEAGKCGPIPLPLVVQAMSSWRSSSTSSSRRRRTCGVLGAQLLQYSLWGGLVLTCPDSRRFVIFHGCSYHFIERANRLAERIAPGYWTADKQPLCAFVRSSRPFFASPTAASACNALAAACSPELVPVLHAIARVAAPSVTPADILGFVRVSLHSLVALSAVVGGFVSPRGRPSLPPTTRLLPCFAMAVCVLLCMWCACDSV